MIAALDRVFERLVCERRACGTMHGATTAAATEFSNR
jgi:hypothetical protein